MKNRNFFLLIVLALCWAPSFLFIKVAVEDFPPLTLVAIRLGLAAVFLYIVLRLNKRSLPTGWAFWKKFFIMGFFANSFPFVLFAVGEQFTQSGAASILNGTTPIFTVMFAHFILADERLTRNRVSGVLLGFVGILFLFLPELQALMTGAGFQGGAETFGLILFIVASISYGFAISYGRANLRGLPPLVGPAAQLICATAMSLPVALLVDQPFHLTPSLAGLGSAVGLGILGTAFAYLVYYKLMETASAAFVSFVTYLLPPMGVLLGVLFLDELLTWNLLAGLVLIVIGAMTVNGTRLLPRRTPASVTAAAD